MEIQTKGQEVKKQNKDWLMDLERERLDRSYLNPKPSTAITEFTRIVYRDRPIDYRFRDNIMFHAGRYAEGARDPEAKNAHKVAANLISKKENK
jgi:hypothetical protein